HKIMNAIKAGATGYILKNENPQSLIEQIKCLYQGGSPLSPNIARKLITEVHKLNEKETSHNYNLTPREKEILQGIRTGLTYKEIAEQYFIAPSTVKKHIAHIYQKLGVSSKVEFMTKVMTEKIF
ncbi:MAG: response regulator transcription factor, partial [Spirochaetes bacterium]|nr:response regulator transcription factor [Spirochaetota bacterium]